MQRVLDRILAGENIRDVIAESAKAVSTTLIDDPGDELDEKQVHLNKSQWSKFGNCVVLAGGSGSGKGWVKDNLIAADFQQVLDVDALKLMYNNLVANGKIDDPHGTYDLSNADDVSALHGKIKTLKWDKLKQSSMFKWEKALPNILFDITGRETDKLKDIGGKAKSVGYNTILCWVLTPRDVAILGNLSRPRKVSQQVFHSVHNAVKSSVLSFLTTDAGNYYDEAFLCFNPGKDVTQLPSEIQDIAKKHDIVELKKTGNSFELPDDLKKAILDFLGADDDPDNPKVYKDFKDIDVSQGVSAVKR